MAEPENALKKFTVEEAALLRELLDKLQVQPTAPNALETVTLIQRIYAKIQSLTAS